MISDKQKQILAFSFSKYDALICDGAVRSGKTSIMMVAFIDWAMREFNGQWFGICGRTVDSARKNVVTPYLNTKYARHKYRLNYKQQAKVLEVQANGVTNYFEVFGGANESSQDLIQGRTFAGVFVDEVTLQPQSFVQQAVARCSVEGAKLWFDCNPSSPSHWFYREWIMQAEKKNALYLHLTMLDNPGISQKTIDDYNARFTGVFYDRYILGKWVTAYGLVYPNFKNYLCQAEEIENLKFDTWYIACDYGVLNPMAMLLIGRSGNTWYVVNEYYYNGRDTGEHKTDAEYYDDLEKLAGRLQISGIIVDPSATSFITVIQRGHKFKVWDAKNDVISGIQHTTQALEAGRVRVCENCESLVKEFGLYSWDEKNTSGDKPIKKNDHALDALRYFVETAGVWSNDKKRTVPWLI